VLLIIESRSTVRLSWLQSWKRSRKVMTNAVVC
jgi:hypothetical protein